jgi:hypothetical protein
MGVSSDLNDRCSGHRRVHHSGPCQSNLKSHDDDNAYAHACDPLENIALLHNFLLHELLAPDF